MIDRTQSLASQCYNGDIICISKVYAFRVKWNNVRKELCYYTNLSYNTLRIIVLQEYKIVESDWDKYSLKIQGHFVSLESSVPYEGICEELELAAIKGK